MKLVQLSESGFIDMRAQKFLQYLLALLYEKVKCARAVEWSACLLTHCLYM